MSIFINLGIINDIATYAPASPTYHEITFPDGAGRSNYAAATVGTHFIVFGGGFDLLNGVSTSRVDAYNMSLTHSTPSFLSQARYSLSAASVEDFVLFVGGLTTTTDGINYFHSPRSTVDAYNLSLVRSSPVELTVARSNLASTTISGIALFGGGDSNGMTSGVVDAYNTSLVRTTATSLSTNRRDLAATTVANSFALFGGGYSSVVDAYNTSLVRSTPVSLSSSRGRLSATSVEDFGVFGGGELSTGVSDSTTDAYNISLVRSTPAASLFASSYAASSANGFAIFGGGVSNDGGGAVVIASVVSYNASLVQSILTPLSVARWGLSASSIGNFVLFGGGNPTPHGGGGGQGHF